MENSSSFFRNYACDQFPCHKTADTDAFNCLFCYCPLYHLEDCGGHYSFTENGVKDCSDCTLPHKAGNYKYVIHKLTINKTKL